MSISKEILVPDQVLRFAKGKTALVGGTLSFNDSAEAAGSCIFIYNSTFFEIKDFLNQMHGQEALFTFCSPRS